MLCAFPFCLYSWSFFTCSIPRGSSSQSIMPILVHHLGQHSLIMLFTMSFTFFSWTSPSFSTTFSGPSIYPGIWLSFIFTHWSFGMTKPTRWEVHFFFLINTQSGHKGYWVIRLYLKSLKILRVSFFRIYSGLWIYPSYGQTCTIPSGFPYHSTHVCSCVLVELVYCIHVLSD